MIKKIFLIHAPARSGKNTCAEAMMDYYKSKNKRCCIVAFGDVVKFMETRPLSKTVCYTLVEIVKSKETI